MRTPPLSAAVLAAAVAASALAGTVPAAAADAGGAASACVRPSTSGTTTLDVAFEGETYPVPVHVPADLRPGPVPLVLDLHGSSANGVIQMQVSGLSEVADDEGFVVAAPSGDIPLAPSSPPHPAGSWAWNVPGVPTTAGQLPPPTARDDVAFLARVVDVVSERLCTDDRRTYATGHSGGGRMTSTLGCRLSDRIAAIAPNAGLRAGRPDPDDVTVPEAGDCRPERAVPVVTFHGQQDVVNPYQGNGDLRWGYTAPLAVATWAELDECRRGPRTTAVSEHVTLTRYVGCRQGAAVHFYDVADGGHTWPGSDGPPHGPGLVTREIDASRIIWDFFEGYRLRGRL
ncbi:PHB depolymerase family esterase [uncultured Pseudokineococcus sp.]|uniref:alpha/beta hydrolase family esterase n=1 Tax=uncultured Pseudokineococcus sp. TaxID=1642928 RepID=UPI00260C6086|nr:hypothetical protein [uncultured Pseudokineococcus sp.]